VACSPPPCWAGAGGGEGAWSWELAALAAAGPVLWLAGDLAATGDPLHSLTGTRENVATLGARPAWPTSALPAAARRRGPARAGARRPVVGGALTAWLAPRRALVPAAAGALAVAAFVVLAAAGLPIITRYTFAVDAILVCFCAAGAFAGCCWQTTIRGGCAGGDRRSGARAAARLRPVPGAALDRTRDAIALQDGVEGDLWTVALPRCPDDGALGVVNHRLSADRPAHRRVPGRHPRRAAAGRLRRTYVGPSTARVARAFVLDPATPRRRSRRRARDEAGGRQRVLEGPAAVR